VPLLDPEEPGPVARIVPVGLFLGSALVAALLLRLAWFEPELAAVLLAAGAVAFGVRWLLQRRARRLLRSGNVDVLLARWARAAEQTPHRETLGPLMAATAYAAFGFPERAREAIAAAARGPAWEATHEHRLFLDTLLCTFEGDRDGALERAERLARLPMPPVGARLQERVETLREAVAALARAFAHVTRPGDAALLERTAESSPLVFWAMRYAGAVIAIDEGDPSRARRLLEGAPKWPEGSAFRGFHEEITQQLPAAPT
jgi:hypothetical protein